MFRTKNDLVEPEWRITKYRKSFLPFATSLWNSLDVNTRQITNYESFKDTLIVNINDNPLFYVGSILPNKVFDHPLISSSLWLD